MPCALIWLDHLFVGVCHLHYFGYITGNEIAADPTDVTEPPEMDEPLSQDEVAELLDQDDTDEPPKQDGVSEPLNQQEPTEEQARGGGGLAAGSPHSPIDQISPEGPFTPKISLKNVVSKVKREALHLYSIAHRASLGFLDAPDDSDLAAAIDVAVGKSLASIEGSILAGSVVIDEDGITIEGSITTESAVGEDGEIPEQPRRHTTLVDTTKLIQLMALRWYRENVISQQAIQMPEKARSQASAAGKTQSGTYAAGKVLSRTDATQEQNILDVTRSTEETGPKGRVHPVSTPEDPFGIMKDSEGEPERRPTHPGRHVSSISGKLAPLLGPTRSQNLSLEDGPRLVVQGFRPSRHSSLKIAVQQMMAEALRLYLERYCQTFSQHMLMVEHIASQCQEEEQEDVALTQEERGEQLMQIIQRMSSRALRMYAEDTNGLEEEVSTTSEKLEEDIEVIEEDIPEEELVLLGQDEQLRLRLGTLTEDEFGRLSIAEKLQVNLAQTTDEEFDKLTVHEKEQVKKARKTVTEIPHVKKVIREKRAATKVHFVKRHGVHHPHKPIKTFQIPIAHDMCVVKGKFRSHALGQHPAYTPHHMPTVTHPVHHVQKTHHIATKPQKTHMVHHPVHSVKGGHPKGHVKMHGKHGKTGEATDKRRELTKVMKTKLGVEEIMPDRHSKTEDEILIREFADIHGVEYDKYHRRATVTRLSLRKLVERPSLLKKVLHKRGMFSESDEDIATEESLYSLGGDIEVDSLMSLPSEEELREIDDMLEEEGVDVGRLLSKSSCMVVNDTVRLPRCINTAA